MSKLDEALARLRGHDGVEHLILLGRDGLVIQHVDGRGLEEAVAARIPTLVGAAEALGSAGTGGRVATVVLEFEQGVGIVTVLPHDLLLAAFVRPGVGFAQLLRALRSERDELAGLL
jgi:predicted regulator of Ras-like GTPase activity (Roadblock/LC7/MglB family)